MEIPVNTSPAKNGRRVMGNLSIREQSEDTKGLFSSFCEIQGKYRSNSKQTQGDDTKGLFFFPLVKYKYKVKKQRNCIAPFVKYRENTDHNYKVMTQRYCFPIPHL